MEQLTKWQTLPDVNTGRQNEMDDAKGFLLLGIVLIHAFQTNGNALARGGAFYKVLFGLFMVSGACLYLFSMGFGIAFTKKNTVKDLGKNGVRLLLEQLLCNLCYAALLFVPFEVWKLFAEVPQGLEPGVMALVKSMLLFANIFFIAGMIYLVMAVLKKLRLPVCGYFVVGGAAALLSPLMAQLKTGNATIDFLLNFAFGSSGHISFCFFPYISFVCTGYGFGMLLKKVENKAAIYRKGCLVAGLIVAVAAVWFCVAYPTLDEKYSVLVKAYLVPGILKLIVSDAVIFLLLAFFFFFRTTLEKSKWLTGKIRFFAKHISKYYAIHIGIYQFYLIFTGYKGLGTLGCIVLFFPVMLLTDLLVTQYVRLRTKAATKQGV